jgi:FAD/FMN-containing dehydrogenase
MVAVKDPAAAVELLGLAKSRCGQFLTAFELISGPALELVLKYLGEEQPPFAEHHDWMVLIELTSNTTDEALAASLMEVLEQGMELGHALDAVVAGSLSQAETLWRIREEISDAQTVERGSVRCDVSVPISAIARFIESATKAVLDIEPQTRMVIYGHMGDGNVHFNPLRPANVPADSFVEEYAGTIAAAVDDIAHAEGGSISAEHGIGIAKRDALLHYKSRVDLEIMWSVKRALDPSNILNPGKVLPSLEAT